MDRRDFLRLATVSSLSLLAPGIRGWAYSNGKDDPYGKKLIVILLRGGVDGLNVVVPYGDAKYYDLRPKIAIQRPGAQDGIIDLDGYFGLHPALAPLLPFWQNKTLAFVHACGSPDPSRSHFDAQDYMESGVPGNRTVSSGWLNRLVSKLPSKHSAVQAISIGPVLPRIFAGPATIATIAQTAKIKKTALDTPVIADAFKELYNNPKDDLGRAFMEGMAAHKEITTAMASGNAEPSPMDKEQIIANKGAPSPVNYNQYGKQLSQLFKKSPSIQVAFLDFGGWDTHVNQGAGKGQLANHLKPLALGLADLINGLGPMYKQTTIAIMSEFGRTAKENGNGGTDHGHGNVMWLFGSDIPGGNVYGKWGGLSANALHEARDLPTSTDFRDILTCVLNEHMEISKDTLAQIFPDFQSSKNPFVHV